MIYRKLISAIAAGLLAITLVACDEAESSSDAYAEPPPSAGSTSGASDASSPDDVVASPVNPPDAPGAPVPSPPLATIEPQTPQSDSPVPPGMVKVPAIIESAQFNVAESYPPQYFVHVVAGLSNGCAEFYGYETTRDGNEIHIEVTNLEPAPTEPIACTEIYRTHEFGVPLGTEFESGDEISVTVNDYAISMIAE